MAWDAGSTDQGQSVRPVREPWRQFAQAPLVPVAIALTIGLILDRYRLLPASSGFLLVMFGSAVWFFSQRKNPLAGQLCLLLGFVGVGLLLHHDRRYRPANHVSRLAPEQPELVRIRGVLLTQPVVRQFRPQNPLEAVRIGREEAVLGASQLGTADGQWLEVTGKCQLAVDRPLEGDWPAFAGLQAGDSVEILGIWNRPFPPRNPGEIDRQAQLHDQGIGAEIRVSYSSATVVRLEESVDPWLAQLASLRNWAAVRLESRLPDRQAALARALILGDRTAMDQAEWETFIRSGVVHVLVISGQHLFVLAAFVWLGLRLFGVPRRTGAWIVPLVILGYVIFTGLRPSGIRAAVMVAAVCGSILLRRPPTTANSFALAWIIVVVLNPTDPFSLGCQLSFLSVFVLIWGIGLWLQPGSLSPIDQLIDEARPDWERRLRSIGRIVLKMYLVSLALVAANAPLIAYRNHLFTPSGVLAGPILLCLSSFALISGFLFLLTFWLGPLGNLFAAGSAWALKLGSDVAELGQKLPGGHTYLPSPPTWWVLGFYLISVPLVLVPRWRRNCWLAMAGWVAVAGWIGPGNASTPGELRVAFLAVGHGAYTVIETPDGRCLIYDAGSTTGTGAVRRVVAPYLWQRGIRRIDEILISHADIDHYNGLIALAERFPIGQLTVTPSFAEKPTAEIFAVLQLAKMQQIPMRITFRGDRFQAGTVELEVLHPPAHGPGSIENERSLVLALRHGSHTILLTGDLEKAGTEMVLAEPPVHCDVLVVPHHGSRAALPLALLDWCRPKMLIVSRGRDRGNVVRQEDLPDPKLQLWETQVDGCVTVRSHPSGLVAETFVDKKIQVIAAGWGR